MENLKETHPAGPPTEMLEPPPPPTSDNLLGPTSPGPVTSPRRKSPFPKWSPPTQASTPNPVGNHPPPRKSPPRRPSPSPNIEYLSPPAVESYSDPICPYPSTAPS
ncbi:hypothetical protein TIFTF001_000388 [Ficus carica]|uniref:Uncharacterized protein n=1 Tax=Ficus carica TaxID=3494 RepID=A0AA87YVH5_FICCA|nr:hypothetical protein TIFTF001_000388 [Ficus carica]